MNDRNAIVPIPVELEHPHDVARILEDEVGGTVVEQTVTTVGTPVPTPAVDGVLTIQTDGTPGWQPAAPVIGLDSRPLYLLAHGAGWTVPTTGLYYAVNMRLYDADGNEVATRVAAWPAGRALTIAARDTSRPAAVRFIAPL